jgi:Ca2+/Na+ antiporter
MFEKTFIIPTNRMIRSEIPTLLVVIFICIISMLYGKEGVSLIVSLIKVTHYLYILMPISEARKIQLIEEMLKAFDCPAVFTIKNSLPYLRAVILLYYYNGVNIVGLIEF